MSNYQNGHTKINPYQVSTNINGNPPPHNVEAETALLSCILNDQDAILLVEEFLSPEHFFNNGNGWIYEAMQSLSKNGRPIDEITVQDELRRQGKEIELGGIRHTAVTANAHYCGKIIETSAMRRRMINTAKKMALLARDETTGLDGQLEQAENLVYGLRGQALSGGLEPPKQHARTFLDTLERRHANQGKMDGLATGFVDLDRVLGGLSPKQFYCLAGRPGMGKTSLLLAICDYIGRTQKKKVALFTLEMDKEQIDRRIVAKETRIDTMRLRQGDIKDYEWESVHRITGELSESGLHIDDTGGITPSQIRAKTRRMKSEHGLDLIVIDHLHLMAADRPTGNTVDDITEISRSLAMMGKDLGVPILAAAQLSRSVEQRSDKRPLLSDLRGSGGIEENAFCVMFIYRDEYYNPDSTERPNIGEVNIAKHRDGPTGVIDLYWHGALATFRNLQRQEITL